MLLAFTYQLFIVKNNFAPAGINGIATMIQYKTGFSIGYMSLIINVPLCSLAYFFVNRDFAKKSLLFCLVYSFAYLGALLFGFVISLLKAIADEAQTMATIKTKKAA